MSESNKSQSFWTTLPGLLAGLGTFITAMIGMFTFLVDHKTPSKPPGIDAKPYRTAAMVDTIRSGNDNVCQQVVGNWLWATGAVQFSSEGYVGWRPNYTDTRPLYTGTWSCTDSANRRFAIVWPNGFVDTLTLSPDGNSLSGANQVGYPVKGTRVK